MYEHTILFGFFISTIIKDCYYCTMILYPVTFFILNALLRLQMTKKGL